MADITMTFTNASAEEIADAQAALEIKNAERAAAELPPFANPVAMLIDHIKNEYQPYLAEMRARSDVDATEFKDRFKLADEATKSTVKAYLDTTLPQLP